MKNLWKKNHDMARARIMKKIWTIFVIFSFSILFSIPCSAGPKAVLSAPDFHFQPLPEGEELIHEFVVKNQGDAPLNIIKVVPP